MLPNVAHVLTPWLQPVILKTKTTTSVDFEKTTVITTSNIQAVVQVADKQKLNAESIDWSKEYKWFHSPSAMAIGQYVEHKGKDYKLVMQGDDYSDYGYYAFAGEETMAPVMEAS